MKKTTSLLCLLLALVLVLGLFAGCGNSSAQKADEDNSSTSKAAKYEPKYPELEDMMDRGDYNGAIAWITALRDADAIAAAQANATAAETEALALISGSYLAKHCDYDDPNATAADITICDNYTLVMNGETYVFSMEDRTADYNDNLSHWHLSYEVPDPDFGTIWNGLYVDISESGIVSIDGNSFTYLLNNNALEECLRNAYEPLVGSYIQKENYYNKYESVVINPDMTISLDDVTYSLDYFYNPTFENPFTFIIAGLPRYGLEYSYLYPSVTDSGLSYILDYFYKADQFEVITLTTENLMDYFEWSEPIGYGVSTDAFGEVDRFIVGKFLTLKEEYASRYVDDFSTIAIALDYQTHCYYYARLGWNTADNSVIWELGSRATDSYSTQQQQSVLDRFEHISLQDGTELYYLTCVTRYITRNDSGSVFGEDGIYYNTQSYIDVGKCSDNAVFSRCESTLVLLAK